jgi:hypothetical protein
VVSATDPYTLVSSVGVIADSVRLRVGGREAVQRSELGVDDVRAGADPQPQRITSDVLAANRKRICMSVDGWRGYAGWRRLW